MSVPCRMRCEDSQAPAQLSLTININMNVNEFIEKYREVKELSFKNTELSTEAITSRCPQLVCKDGFTVQIQAGQFMYSTPNEVIDFNEEKYDRVEVGYPSEEEPVLLEFAENRHVSAVGRDHEGKLVRGMGTLKRFLEHHGHLHRQHDWNTVYGYVPVGIVDDIIKKHGGVDESKIK